MTWPDVEYGMRDYLRGYNNLLANKVHTGNPKGETIPYVTVSRVGGGRDAGEAPVDNALVQFDVWGNTKEEAFTWSKILWDAFEAITTPRTVATGTVVLGAEVNSEVWLPDPVDNTPRYVITAVVYCRIP